MKSKLLAMGSVAALIASPLAMADKSAGGPAVCGVAKGDAEGSAGDETVVDPVVTNDEVLQNTVTEGEATAEPGPKGEPVCDKTPADCEEGHVPIDEVKRGEGELEKIKIATEGLMIASQKFAQQLYEQASADGGYAQTSPTAGASADEDVVDAEIIEDDKDEK